jgi:hypothetical protein
MDWSNEEYVRLYTRETADDLELSWEALALWRAMLCKFDRSGVIPVRNGWPSIARMVRMPTDVVERAGPELVTDGRVRVTKHGFVAPNFTEAQTASKSDKARQKDSRDRRRETALVKPPEITGAGHDVSRAVTNRDTESRDVTLPLLPLPPVAEAPVALPPVVTTADAVTSAPAHQSAIDHFHTLYLNAYGKKPSWEGKQIGMIRKLVAKHGADEVKRRTSILFDSPPPFLTGPHDVGTLVQHFDKLVRPSSRRGGAENLDHLLRLAGEQP